MKNAILVIFCFCMLFNACHLSVSPPEAIMPVPSERQMVWHELEQYAFVHFSINTFTGKEWGYGDESPSIFNPVEFNAEQWVLTIKEAGLKGLVLTCKHHDGFCLWPGKYTEHSVKNSLWRDGKGDVVREVSDACRKHNILFGIYLSPWDRNNIQYGSPEYISYYRNQLAELIENYGPVFEVWFDGANGGDGYYGGARETRNVDNTVYYDWPATIAMVRKLNPNAIMFSDAGPDIRWCGNEKGYAGLTNWHMISTDTLWPGKLHINKLLNEGSINGTDWVPAEVDVSIRPGWFYHSSEDDKVRSPENLFKIYLESVGRGANLILNIPPDTRGLFHEKDIQALIGWKKLQDDAFAINLASKAKVKTDTYRGKSRNYAAYNIIDGNRETYWTTDDTVKTGIIEINLRKSKIVKYILIQEYIKLGQRVKNFDVEIWKDNVWINVASGTTIGYKRILSVSDAETSKIRIKINDSRACPIISNVEVY